ncbi:cytochrome P450 9e2-like [Belonocnema kinseyi]|uniref:cytochrome P450 9e2-like n=1 Tax=Belonocnema kinseyi TaxID=2817044 RepID=UPI00143CCF04|nr:cytochrome P450 9e2-like [Belonocnema kinseyi]
MFFYISLVFLTFLFFYYYLKYTYNYWKSQGIPTPERCLPLIGNMWKVVSLQESFSALCERLYKNESSHSMLGIYQIRTPILVIRDADLVKKVMLTDFNSFRNNAINLHQELDPLFIKNPFYSGIETWKENRIALTNGFSPRKLQAMFSLIREVSSKFQKYLDKSLSKNDQVEFELNELFTKYTSELVMTVGLGIEGYCFDEKSMTFGKIVTSVFGDSALRGNFSQVILFFFPHIAKLMKVGVVSKEMEVFLRKLVRDVINSEGKDTNTRNDFMHIMLEAEKDGIDQETNLTVHFLSFMIDVYESVGNTLSFLGYQLALRPEIQEKARDEIKSVLMNCNGELTVEACKDLNYLEQVINESIRFFPDTGTFRKICTYETQLVGYDGLSCLVKPGHVIAISAHGLHKDPKYWPDPEQFDPDRFSEERKHDLHKFAFLPFGAGPRMCVGMRLAMLMMKMAMTTILRNYSLEISPKTKLPLKRDLTKYLTNAKGGIWVFVKPLEKKF